MPSRLLCVGNCAYDQGRLNKTLVDELGTQVTAVDTAQDALAALEKQSFDLVMVNRLFDINADSGLAFMKRLKEDSRWHQLPMMLISNHEDAQQEARRLGALPGFGKALLGKKQLGQLLAPYVQTPVASQP